LTKSRFFYATGWFPQLYLEESKARSYKRDRKGARADYSAPAQHKVDLSIKHTPHPSDLHFELPVLGFCMWHFPNILIGSLIKKNTTEVKFKISQVELQIDQW